MADARQDRIVAIACFLAATGAGTSSMWAHGGPAFPILVDQHTQHYIVSVWADPDVGEATFYVIVEPRTASSAGETLHVSMWVQPVCGRLDPATYEGQRQVHQNRMLYEVKPHFDRCDQWNIGVTLSASCGLPEVLLAKVESTPQGLGGWDFAVYLFPFVAIGVLWTVGMMRRGDLAADLPKDTKDADC